MSLTLILTRHAKSDWASPLLPDHDRPLNGRGRRDAPRLGSWLAREGFAPTGAAISSAARTRETWALLAEGLGPAAPPGDRVTVAQALYHAEPAAILAQVRQAGTRRHLILSHNPGIAQAAADLARRAPDHPRFEDFPTGATLVLSFADSDWADVDWGEGRVLAFVTPHDLADPV